MDDVAFEQRIIETIREHRARELSVKLRKEFPSLVRYCPHVKQMIEATNCPPEEQYVYDQVCWTCKREQK